MSTALSHHPALGRNGLHSLTDVDIREINRLTNEVVIVDVGMRMEHVAGIALVAPEELARRTMRFPTVLSSKARDDYDFLCFCGSLPTWRAGNGWLSHLISENHLGTYHFSVFYVFLGASNLIDLI